MKFQELDPKMMKKTINTFRTREDKGRKKPLVPKMSSCPASFRIKERRLGYVEKK